MIQVQPGMQAVNDKCALGTHREAPVVFRAGDQDAVRGLNLWGKKGEDHS